MHKASIAVIAVLAAIPGGATPVAAFHRQTPPIVRITSSGDDTLPRAAGPRLTFSVDPSHLDPNGYFEPPKMSLFAPATVSVLRQNWIPRVIELIENGANPTSSVTGHVIAFEEDCSLFVVCSAGDTGRQIFLWLDRNLTQVTHDPTGTSVNPALDGLGDLLAFESQGNLVGTGASGSSQIFLATVGPPGSNPTLTQVTQGSGASQNAALSLSGATLVFESTNDAQGNDTGVSQIWLTTTRLGGAPMAITKGAAPSVSPSISADGRIVAFASTAAVASDGHDTGVSQIFTYDTRTRAITQLTDDPAGCSKPSVSMPHHDWRVAFVCNGIGFFHLLKKQQRFELPIPAGADTASLQALPMGSRPNFFTVSTTANLTGGAPVANLPGSGTTSGHQLYLLNLFKVPAIPVN